MGQDSGVCEREKMLNGKRSESDGWALEREGLSQIETGQRSRSAGALHLSAAISL